MEPSPPPPQTLFFRDRQQFRDWLAANHASATEAWLGFHRKETGRAGLAYVDAVEEALCFGWIDGIRRTHGDGVYVNCFTPRKRSSTWSNLNIRRMERLIAEDRVHPAGLAAFSARDPAKSGLYAFEQGAAALPPGYLARLHSDTAAFAFFDAQPPHYRRAATYWVVSAKREETRLRRLEALIADSAAGRWIAPMRRPPRP